MIDNKKMCEEYCSKLKEKIKLLGNYHEATASLRTALTMRDDIRDIKDVDRIFACVEKRQRAVDKIDRLDSEIICWIEKNKFSIRNLSSGSQEEADNYLVTIRKVLEALLVRDEDCIALAQAEYDSIRSEIIEIKDRSCRAAGYTGRTVDRDARFLDLRQ